MPQKARAQDCECPGRAQPDHGRGVRTSRTRNSKPELATKLTLRALGYDNTFDYFALGVKNGVVTVEGQDRTGIGRDEAMAEIANMPGVKDVIDNISSRAGLDVR